MNVIGHTHARTSSGAGMGTNDILECKSLSKSAHRAIGPFGDGTPCTPIGLPLGLGGKSLGLGGSAYLGLGGRV
jgi:hypothetical protein